LIEEQKITCSFGIAVLRDEDIDVWFKRADEALYRAKAAGRNQVESA
jgi:GGDEF domain-containing protein